MERHPFFPRRRGPLLAAAFLLGGGPFLAPAHGASARLFFQPDSYSVAEDHASLLVTLAIEPPPCAGRVEVLESTATIGTLADGSATSGVDFQPASAQVPLGGSRTNFRHTFQGLIFDDQALEGEETFHLTLTLTPGAEVRCEADGMVYPLTVAPGDDRAAIRILDDDAQPLLRLERPRPVREGDAGTTEALVRVRLSRPSFNAVSVDFSAGGCPSSGTADPGTDYVPVHRRLTFLYPETEKQVAVPFRGDVLDEEDETFPVCLSAPLGAEIAPGEGETSGTILDDDDPPSGECRVEAIGGDQQEVTQGPPGRVLQAKVTLGGVAVHPVVVEWQADESKARLQPDSSTTNDQGVAETRVVLQPHSGTVRVTASASTLDRCREAVFILNGVDPNDPIPDPKLCDHPDLLPESARAACEQNRPRPVLPDEVAAQADLGVEALGLQGRFVRGRLETGAESSKPGQTGVYAGATQGSGSRTESVHEAGYDYTLRGLGGGVDAEPVPGLVLGGAVGFLHGEAEFAGAGGSLGLRLLCVTAYGAYQSPSAVFHLEGLATWGRPRFTLERSIMTDAPEPRRAVSSASGSLLELSLGGRAERPFGPFSLEARGFARWDEAAIDAFEESGAGDLDLAIGPQRLRSLVAEAGLRLRYSHAFQGWALALRLGADALHELADDSRTIEWRFLRGPFPQQTFAVSTERPDRDYFAFAAELRAKLPGPWSTFLRFRQEAQHEHVENRSLVLGVLAQF